jgi:hypothetical protein
MAQHHKKQSLNTHRRKQSPGVEEAILSRAIEHPSLGPQRLTALLKSEGVVVTKGQVYHVLQRKRLQTRKLREEFIAQAKPQDETPPAVTPVEIKVSELVPEQPAEALLVNPSAPAMYELPREPEGPPAIPPSPTAPVSAQRVPRENGRLHPPHDLSNWAFLGANLLLAGLAVVFAVQIGDLIQNGLGTPPSQAIASTAIQAAPGPQKAPSTQPQASADAYRVIVERNLFGSASVTKEEKLDAGIAQIKLAGTEVGLSLVGTTVSKKSGMNQAVIESTAQHTQAIYRERERVGSVLIKRILRNNVIIETDKGELRLTVDYENIKSQPSGRGRADIEKPPGVIVSDAGPEKPQEAMAKFSVPKASFSLSAAQTALYINQMGLDPTLPLSPATGLPLAVVSPQNPLSLLGLVTGDVIHKFEVGGADLAGLDLETMYKIFAQGGDFSVLVERRGRPMRLSLSIQ